MKLRKRSATALLLILMALPGTARTCPVEANPSRVHQTVAPMHSITFTPHLRASSADQPHHQSAAALPQTPAHLHFHELRDHFVHLLKNPDVAVLVLMAGVLLIFLECNLPGAIIPGASGLLLVLSGIYGLSLHTIDLVALLVLLAAIALLALAARTPSPLLSSAAGSLGLIYGLARLIVPANSVPDQHTGVLPSVAAITGLILGSSTFALGRVAERARKNKRILSSGKETLPPRDLA